MTFPRLSSIAAVVMLTGLIAEHLANGGLTVLTSHQAVEIGAIPVQILELRA